MRKQSMKTWISAGALLAMPFAVNAAGLGKLTVTSALGQPLRGEIELVAVQKEDVGSVSVRVASQEAFREAKIDRPGSLSSMRFSVERRANGEPYIKVTSASPINEPFLDLLIELNWPSGRLMREYTVLLDPPGFAEPQAVAPVTVPQGAALPATPAAPAAPVAGVEAQEVFAPAAPTRKAPEKAPAKAARAEQEKAAEPQAGADTYGPVKKGETLAKIASQVKPEGVSLEQMLVGLYRGNPQAFVGNMNRMKTGQILRLPEAEKLAELTSKDAAREVKVQAADWHAYRQKLAAAVAGSVAEKPETSPQAAAGKITPKVEDKAAKPAPSADVLKLSKGEAGKEVKGLQDKVRSLEEEATARDKTVKEANERISQLEKNVKEMQKLVDLKNQALADLQKQAAKPQPPVAVPAKPPVAEVKPAPEIKPAPVEVAPAPKAEVKPEPQAVKPKPVAKPKPAPAPAPAAEPAWYEGIMSNSLAMGGSVAVVVAGLLGWLMVLGKRRRKNLTTFEDSIMSGGDLKANTVYGEAAGGVVDTGDTSFLTDFSQAGLGNIDTNDVDPIAEAEVYMAYGRDAQAEEILKEAMNKDPNRHEIQLKLLEIYAGRKNTNAFEALASELYAAIGGQPGPVWDKAAEMGRQLDPSNPLYSTGGAVARPAESGKPGMVEAAAVAAGAAGLAAVQEVPLLPELEGAPEMEEISEDVASDLDFNLDTEPVYEEPLTVAPEMASVSDDDALDFDLGLSLPQVSEEAPAPVSEPEAEEEADLAMTGVSLDMQTIIPQVVEKQAAQEVVDLESAPLDFDQALAFELPEVEAADAEPVAEVAAEEAAEAEQIVLESMDLEAPEQAMEEVTLSAPQEAPLDFDFQMEEEGAVATEGAAMPDLDLAGISLDLDETTIAATTVTDEDEAGGGDSLWQEVATKLDLAKAYVEMGDKEGAREILQEVLAEGDGKQQEDARSLLSGI